MIYLDHGATSFPKAPGVAEATDRFLRESAGNPGRGGHAMTLAASHAIEATRERLAELLGSDAERTLLGSGATFWLNTVLQTKLAEGGRVVCSAVEHNAVMRPLRHLERTVGVRLAEVESSSPDGVPTPGEIADAVTAEPTDLVVLCHASNVSGALLPVEEIARAVAPVPVIVDGAQSAGSVPFDFESSGVAAYACSGHKGLLGPPGTGALLLADWIDVEPLVRGGTGSHSDREEMPEELPDRLEAGTPNGAGIAGLGAAVEWLLQRSVEAVHQHESVLAIRLVDGLREVSGVDLHGWKDDRRGTGVVSFTLRGADTGELAGWLDVECGIAVRPGLHCAPAAHRRLGTYPDGTVRAGIGPFNDERDVDALVDAVAAFRRNSAGGGA